MILNLNQFGPQDQTDDSEIDETTSGGGSLIEQPQQPQMMDSGKLGRVLDLSKYPSQPIDVPTTPTAPVASKPVMSAVNAVPELNRDIMSSIRPGFIKAEDEAKAEPFQIDKSSPGWQALDVGVGTLETGRDVIGGAALWIPGQAARHGAIVGQTVQENLGIVPKISTAQKTAMGEEAANYVGSLNGMIGSPVSESGKAAMGNINAILEPIQKVAHKIGTYMAPDEYPNVQNFAATLIEGGIFHGMGSVPKGVKVVGKKLAQVDSIKNMMDRLPDSSARKAKLKEQHDAAMREADAMVVNDPEIQNVIENYQTYMKDRAAAIRKAEGGYKEFPENQFGSAIEKAQTLPAEIDSYQQAIIDARKASLPRTEPLKGDPALTALERAKMIEPQQTTSIDRINLGEQPKSAMPPSAVEPPPMKGSVEKIETIPRSTYQIDSDGRPILTESIGAKKTFQIDQAGKPQLIESIPGERQVWKAFLPPRRDSKGVQLNIGVPIEFDRIAAGVRKIIEETPIANLYRNKELWKETGFWKDKEGHWMFELNPTEHKLLPGSMKPGETKPLREVLDAPKLYSNIPTLKDTKVLYDPAGKRTFYDSQKDQITIHNNSKTGIYHELQHGVQMHFYKDVDKVGSNPNLEANKILIDWIKEKKKNITDPKILKKFATLEQDYIDGYDVVESFKQVTLKDMSKNPERYGIPTNEAMAQIQALGRAMGQKGHDNYMTNKGEMQARVHAERSLNADEMKDFAPWETLDWILADEGYSQKHGQKLYSGVDPIEMVKLAMGKEPERLITKPMRDFHGKLGEDLKERANVMAEKVASYPNWDYNVGDRMRSNKLGYTYTVNKKGWDNKKNEPLYYVSYKDKTGDLTETSLYAKNINEYMTPVKEAKDRFKVIKGEGTTLSMGVDPIETFKKIFGGRMGKVAIENHVKPEHIAKVTKYAEDAKKAQMPLKDYLQSKGISVESAEVISSLSDALNKRVQSFNSDQIMSKDDFSPFKEPTASDPKLNISSDAHPKSNILLSDAQRFLSVPVQRVGGLLKGFTTPETLFSIHRELRPLLDQSREILRDITLEKKEVSRDIVALRDKYSNKSLREEVGAAIHAKSDLGKAAMDKMNIKIKENPAYAPLMSEMQTRFKQILDRVNDARTKIGKRAIPEMQDYLTFFAKEDMLTQAKNFIMGEHGNKYQSNLILDSLDTIRARHSANALDASSFHHTKRTGLRDGIKLELDPLEIYHRYMNESIPHIRYSPLNTFVRSMLKDTLTMPNGKQVVIGEHNPGLAKTLTSWNNNLIGVANVNVPKGLERTLNTINGNMTAATLMGNLRTILAQTGVTAQLFAEYDLTALKGATSMLTMKDVPIDKSSVLSTSLLDASFGKQSHLLSSKARRGFELTKTVGAAPMTAIDYAFRELTWRTAWETTARAVKQGLMTEREAIRRADSAVVRINSSGAAPELSPIQMNALGKTLTLWQTFTINNLNWMGHHMLGIKNPDVSPGMAVARVIKFATATALLNTIFEDGLGIQSPSPAPIKAMETASKEDKSNAAITLAGLKEMMELFPVGAALKYGSHPLGAQAELFARMSKIMSSNDIYYKDVIAKAIDGDTKSQQIITELIATVSGVPGTAQTGKYIRGRERGESIGRALIGNKGQVTGGKGKRGREPYKRDKIR